MNEVGTQEDKQSALMVMRVQAVKLVCRQIRTLYGQAVMGRKMIRSC